MEKLQNNDAMQMSAAPLKREVAQIEMSRVRQGAGQERKDLTRSLNQTFQGVKKRRSDGCNH